MKRRVVEGGCGLGGGNANGGLGSDGGDRGVGGDKGVQLVAHQWWVSPDVDSFGSYAAYSSGDIRECHYAVLKIL